MLTGRSSGPAAEKAGINQLNAPVTLRAAVFGTIFTRLAGICSTKDAGIDTADPLLH
jgi:hypothetical protein